MVKRMGQKVLLSFPGGAAILFINGFDLVVYCTVLDPLDRCDILKGKRIIRLVNTYANAPN